MSDQQLNQYFSSIIKANKWIHRFMLVDFESTVIICVDNEGSIDLLNKTPEDSTKMFNVIFDESVNYIGKIEKWTNIKLLTVLNNYALFSAKICKPLNLLVICNSDDFNYGCLNKIHAELVEKLGPIEEALMPKDI